MMTDNTKDDNLQAELESMYQKVAQNDEAAIPPEDIEDLSPYYSILQVNSDASLAEIATAYDKLKDTWREDRFVNVEVWQEKSKSKLEELKNAYEKILSMRLYEGKDLNREHFESDDPGDAFLTEQHDISADEPGRPVIANNRSVRFVPLFLGTIVIAMFIAGGAFFWPTLYHYETLKSGNQIFPVRINRVTSETTYFNGQSWVKPPMITENKFHSLPSSLPAPTPPPKTDMETQPTQSSQEKPKSLPPASSPTENARQTLIQKKADSQESDLNLRKSAPAAPSVTDKVAKAPKVSAPPPSPPLGKSGPFSIQITAYQEESKAKALVKDLNIGKVKNEIKIQKIIHKEKGVWYRVLMGQFKTREEALRYLKKEKIADAFPGSFVQHTGKAS
ncbi:MAG: hypothetical protein CSYNP_01305 [Syntrophus sp. SKADARSKE-3]|nr:hypothetical protein [Syntrophus sp. SKADARSKE-3]